MTSGDEDPRDRRSADDDADNADLEDALRGMLARRAERVRSGATWQPPSADVQRNVGLRRSGRMPARRWLLPAAAAAVVVALVVTVITVRGSGSPAIDASPGPANSTTGSGLDTGSADGARTPERLAPAPSPIQQQPVPEGKQAVDALGVEIFVSTSLTLDPPCEGKSVSRPASGLTYVIGCVPVQHPTVQISTATRAATDADPTQPCRAAPVLDGETGCLRIAASAGSIPQVLSVIATWPQHDVAITIAVGMHGEQRALDIVESAHWVPVDRHGCAATRSPVVPAGAGSLPGGSVLPADATSTSACWYSGGRLVASATLPATARTGLAHPPAPGNAPGLGVPAPSYSPSPDGPACRTIGRTEGIVFQSTRPDGSIAVSAAQLADCTGGQYWTNGTHARRVDEALASAIYRLTGFLLAFGYRAQPLDPTASSGTVASASDLPTTTRSDEGPVASTSVTAETTVTASTAVAAGTTVTHHPVTARTAVAPAQLPIPDDMQAVDALGVEIFVPKGLPLDPGTCATGPGVSRPIPHIPYAGKCSATLGQPAVWISAPKSGDPATDSSPCQTFSVTLDGETACAIAASVSGGATRYTVSWPRHDVAITAEGTDAQVAQRIVRSAHWVPVDRNGCPATRSPMRPADPGVPPAPPYPILATGATSLSVCWYLGNRLGASALLDAAASASVIDAVNAGAALWPHPADRPSLTPCTTVEKHDGVLLAAHLPGGATAQAVGIFAACNGQQTVGNKAGAVLARRGLVSTIADAAGLQHALSLDYPYEAN